MKLTDRPWHGPCTARPAPGPPATERQVVMRFTPNRENCLNTPRNADYIGAKRVVRFGPWCLLRSSSTRHPVKCAILFAGSLLFVAGALISILTTDYVERPLFRGISGLIFIYAALSVGRSALGAAGVVFRVERVSSLGDDA